jgi:uncharacterized protein
MPPHTTIIKKALTVVRPVFRLNFQDGIHGVAHWIRVWFHGRRIAKSLDVNPAILAWFAFLYDSQRHNDHRDPLHGHRAADFVVILRRERTLVELNATEFEHLCEAMRLHSDGHTEGEAAIRACWGAEPSPAVKPGATSSFSPFRTRSTSSPVISNRDSGPRTPLVVCNSFGAYLFLRAQAGMSPFPGHLLLLSPIVGNFVNRLAIAMNPAINSGIED